LFVVVASYKENYRITKICFTNLVASCRDLPSQIVAVVSVGSEAEIKIIRKIVAECPGGDKIDLRFTLQKHGKRIALGYALRVVARECSDPRNYHNDAFNDLVVMMDGDSATDPDTFKKALPVFRVRPNVGAVTTNNVAVVFPPCSDVVRAWYDLRMIRRHNIMQSLSLSKKVLTLTGRLSVVRADIATSEDFIEQIDRDHILSWMHGRIKFLMGDDKSTCYNLFKNGWDMMYVPNAYVYCMEDRTNSFFKLLNLLMTRWYGNMLRNNGRSLELGLKNMPLWTWISFLDQRICPWTTLLGPVSALMLSLANSGWFMVFYLVWVILTRLLQLWVVVIQGHRMKLVDLPLLSTEQWYGSLIKIYCSVNLHKQVWQKAKTESQTVNTMSSKARLRAAFPAVILGLYAFTFLLIVSLLTGVLKLPSIL
jgi:glycosyltransferase Alg8